MTEIEAGECPVCHTRDEDDSGPHTGNCYIALRDRLKKEYDACMVGGPGGKPLGPFFFGQRMRRVVRELLEGKP